MAFVTVHVPWSFFSSAFASAGGSASSARPARADRAQRDRAANVVVRMDGPPRGVSRLAVPQNNPKSGPPDGHPIYIYFLLGLPVAAQERPTAARQGADVKGREPAAEWR